MSRASKLSADSDARAKFGAEMAGASEGAPARQADKTASGDGGGSNAAGAPKAHFRIDWRQLTYYSKDQRSGLGDLFCRRAKGRKMQQQRQQPCHLLDEAAPDSELEDERPASGERGARGRPILNSLDGCFRSGELAAILGPSGAGKSTFLSALFGNKQESSYGRTRVTWFPARPGAAREQRQRPIRIAFLPQHDHLLNHLSVYETLMFASKIKNPHQAHDKLFHRQNVKRVAKMLKLTECFGTRCGRLSGGQYKRVSIGQELLSEPDVIILDEPTSGLDAMTCLTTVRTLKSIVLKHPISIILTIHQPDTDVFGLFDRVYVIAQGGVAIYEGPPAGVAPTLARANLFMPSESYNPARFIVENAFVADLDASPNGGVAEGAAGPPAAGLGEHGHEGQDDEEADEDEDDEDEIAASVDKTQAGGGANFLRRSISSLTDALAGKTADLRPDHLLLGAGRAAKQRASGRRPLLNIGIQTADGKLVTSEQLTGAAPGRGASALERAQRKQQAERLQLLRRLNCMQKERYYGAPSPESGGTGAAPQETCLSAAGDLLSGRASEREQSASESDASSWSEARETMNASQSSGHFVVDLDEEGGAGGGGGGGATACSVSSGASSAATAPAHRPPPRGRAASGTSGHEDEREQEHAQGRWRARTSPLKAVPRRQFDKRLSAKHIQSKQSGYPIWYHSSLLAHRTWLSIVRDPIFFGIQFAMHTTIPILLALIFGSDQEEGCPQVGNFDLVEFAYAPNGQANFISATMRSIRQSVGNIGIIFFEMFVLSFAINCITALVFPLDMYVLLKEYRNGWYSLRSYFFGRTLADLPVPIVLHSLAMSILCYLTGQPLDWWRFLAIIAIVILASLVAQSVGLTIGALLMRSSQSAVLAAAGIVAPFFALSGFIVRIHTLPWAAKLAAQGSYLYHLLNGFIIMRYGFGRCPCDDEDFEQEPAHAIPGNLKTMASMWIGTYSNEYATPDSQALSATASRAPNRTNVDPNIDVIDKLMGAFRMANSFGHRVDTCDDALPYAMLDFNLKDRDVWHCCLALAFMLLISRAITFSAIYYKIRSFS